MTMPGQIEIIERHVADALARGGLPVAAAGPASAGQMLGRSSSPMCRRRAGAVSEETFGPTLTVDPGRRPGRGRTADERQPLRPRLRRVQ